MLVLSRKAGEKLMIGPNIVLTVLELHGGCVKLGCEAPQEIPIRRAEITEKPKVAAADTRAPRKPESPFFSECA
jgi:carbon storage regulator